MTTLDITQHAAIRLAQRAMNLEDVDLIMIMGVEVADGYLVMDKDANALCATLRHWLQKIERLKGKRIVVDSGHLITAYRPAEAKERKLLRRAAKRDLGGFKSHAKIAPHKKRA